MKTRRLTEIARLVCVLERKDIPWEEKVSQIKLVRDNGDITTDEALDLVTEYCDRKYS